MTGERAPAKPECRAMLALTPRGVRKRAPSTAESHASMRRRRRAGVEKVVRALTAADASFMAAHRAVHALTNELRYGMPGFSSAAPGDDVAAMLEEALATADDETRARVATAAAYALRRTTLGYAKWRERLVRARV